MEQLLTAPQAAACLNTSVRFVRRLVTERRRIEFVKVGRHVRISESARTAFVVAGTVAPLTVHDITGQHPSGPVRPLSGELSGAGRAAAYGLRDVPYERKGDAERALTLIEAKMISGEWTDPDRGKAEFKDYAETWISQRLGLPPRVRAAMIYQHAVRGADKTIRDAIDRHISVAGDGGDSPGLIVSAG